MYEWFRLKGHAGLLILTENQEYTKRDYYMNHKDGSVRNTFI